jgi:hypothetical protein
VVFRTRRGGREELSSWPPFKLSETVCPSRRERSAADRIDPVRRPIVAPWLSPLPSPSCFPSRGAFSMAVLKPFPPGPVVRCEGCHASCLLHGPGGLLTHWQWRAGRPFCCSELARVDASSVFPGVWVRSELCQPHEVGIVGLPGVDMRNLHQSFDLKAGAELLKDVTRL